MVLRGYLPLSSPRLTLAVRVVGDVLFGDVPWKTPGIKYG
jgi:hypothetical protein